MKQHKIYYGWVIVFAGVLIMSTVIGIGWNSFGQFIKPVCADMGFSRRAMSMNQTLLSLVQMFVNLSWGFIIKRFSLKKLMRLSAIVFPIGYFCYSLATELWMFYLVSVIIGMMMATLTTLAFSVILSNWFYEKRGLAIGIAFMGTGIGGMIFNPLAAALIRSVGWRMTYRILAVIIFTAVFVSVFFLLKIRPEEKGLRALGYEHAVEKGEASAENDGLPFKELIKTGRFIAVCICVGCSTMAIGSMTQSMSPHLSDSGYGTQTAAFMVSFCMGALAVGKMTLGVIYDRFGVRRATVISITCGILGITGMIFCSRVYMLPLIVIGQCLGSSFGTVGIPIITEKLFGKRDYGANFGFISAFSSVGGAIAPTLNGAVYDHTGSYNPAFMVWAGLLVMAVITFLIVLPKKDKVKI